MQHRLAAWEPLGPLVPGPCPLEGKSFYLDELKRHSSSVLSKVIVRLGGKVESFLYKDVNVVITGNRDALTRITSSSGKVKGRDSPCEQRESRNDAAQRPGTPRAPVFGSRGKALLEKAIRNNDQSRCGVLSSAALYWGVKIVSVDQFMKVVEDLSSHRSTHTHHRRAEKNLSGCAGVHVIKAGSLKQDFVKVEDFSRKYRPLYSQSLVLPMLSYTRRFSPFENPASVQPGKTKQEEQEDKFRKSEDLINNHNKPSATPSPKMAHRKKRLGFCECCHMKYQDQDEHLQSDVHLRFVEDVNNYAVVDRLVAVMDAVFSGCKDPLLNAAMTRLTISSVAPPSVMAQQRESGMETCQKNQELQLAGSVEVKQEVVCDSPVLPSEPQIPLTDEPCADVLCVNEPCADVPRANEPCADVPRANEPCADVPRANEPCADVPRANEPCADVPRVNEPCADVPRVNEPCAVMPRVNEPCADVPRVNEPCADVPRVNEPCADVPRVNEPCADAPLFISLETKFVDEKLNLTPNSETHIPDPHPADNFLINNKRERSPASPEVESDGHKPSTLQDVGEICPKASPNLVRGASSGLKSPQQHQDDTVSDSPACAQLMEREQTPLADATSHSASFQLLTTKCSDGVNHRKRDRSFTLSPKASKNKRTYLWSDPTNQTDGVNVRFDHVQRILINTCIEANDVTEHGLETDPLPNVVLSNMEAPENRNDHQNGLLFQMYPNNEAPDVSSELGPPQLYPFFHDDIYENKSSFLDPPKLSPSVPFPITNKTSNASLLSQSFSSVCIESALVPDIFSPASSESDWDSGFLSRLAPPVHLQPRGGRCELDLGLLLQRSCTGMQDGSYAAQLCSALQPTASSSQTSFGDPNSVYRPIEPMDRRIIQSMGV